MRKSHLFGGLCFVTLCVTCLAYTPFFRPLENQTTESVAMAGEAFEYGATRLTAVGWESCPYCQKFKTEVIPPLQEEGYEVKYVDRSLWNGPRIRTGPTLFFFKGKVIVKVYQGFMTAEEVKEYLESPRLE